MATDAAPPTPPPDAILLQLIFGKWVSQAVSVAAKLRIADHLAAGPKSAADLAREVSAHPGALYRLLRALTSVGVLSEDAEARFALTPVGEFLRTGVPRSFRGVADYCGSEWSWKPWGDLLGSVRTGETAFDRVYGKPVFEYLAEHPDESAVFNEGMAGFSGQGAAAVAAAYQFPVGGTVVDVGGGHGPLLAAILKAQPGVRGVVFDSPHVVAGAGAYLKDAGVADRCRTEGGDFFAAVPAGGDVYLMKHIIHDWDDARATTILKNCRAAVRPGGKLVVVEIVIPPANVPSPGKLLDLEMLVIAGGMERTEAEYRTLLAGAGWKLTRVVPTQAPTSVIEADPV